MKRFITFLLFFSLVSFYSCSSNSQKPLKISATTWIGYIPLYYAKEKGWLDLLSIKLVNVISLSENMYLYKSGNVDAYAGTQYEYGILKGEIGSLIPIMLFDRSNGGDVIMSNTSIDSLQKSQKKIDAYLEIDSINYILLQDFIKKYGLDPKRINYVNKDQTEIALLKSDGQQNTILIVTYNPYDINLAKQGFKRIMTTKDNLDLLVVDALFTSKDIYATHKDQFIALKKYLDRSIAHLHKDPKEFYDTIKPYLENVNYQDFLDSLDAIEWINHNTSKEIKQRMSKALFPVKDLL